MRNDPPAERPSDPAFVPAGSSRFSSCSFPSLWHPKALRVAETITYDLFSDTATLADWMFERHFVAYGVRIGLRVDCRALLDTLDQDPSCTCHSAGARLKTTSLMLPCPSATSFLPVHRVERGRHTVCMPERTLSRRRAALTDAGRALAAHAELFVAERAPDHLFVHAGVVGWEGRAIVMPGASFAGKTTLVQAWLEAGATYYSDEFAVLDRAGQSASVRPSAGDPGRLDSVDSPRAGRGTGRRDRDDAPAHRTRPGDLVPGRRSLATAPLDGGPDAARADAPHRRRSREPGALDAHSEAGGERWHCVRRCTRRGSPAGFRGSPARPNANAVHADTRRGAI